MSDPSTRRLCFVCTCKQSQRNPIQCPLALVDSVWSSKHGHARPRTARGGALLHLSGTVPKLGVVITVILL